MAEGETSALSRLYCTFPSSIAVIGFQRLSFPPLSNQVSESLQVRIVAGRPIHCQVPGIDHHLVRWAAVRATLEAAKAIALSHLGMLYIAETDERRINRIQQVNTKTDQSRHVTTVP